MGALLALALQAALAAEPGWPRTLQAIEVRGPRWTKEKVVLRELPFRAGEEVTEEQWELGVARLWNSGLFSRVDARVESRDGGEVAVLELEERISLNPLVSFGVGGGAWWFRLGATDLNFLGNFLEWGARYERFDLYNGGQGWVRDPRLFGLRLDGLFQVDYLFRPRPEYLRRRLSFQGELAFEPDPLTRLGLRLEAFGDWYSAPKVGDARVPRDVQGVLGTLAVTAGRLDLIRLRTKGLSVGLRQLVGGTLDPEFPLLAQTQVEVLWFALFGERWNLALRAQGGLSSPAPTELQFYLGGLDLVRGYADSLVRTRAFALANLELRLTILDFTWFALVAAAFVDGAVADDGGPRGLLSAGGGVRLLVPRFVKTGIRADLAVTLLGRVEPGISLGVYQFF